MPLARWASVLAVAASAGGAVANETFLVTPTSVVAFGADGGDSFGLERVSLDTVVVLLRPLGEKCTLRFPLQVGESLLIRTGREQTGQHSLCEASLVGIKGGKAEFSAICAPQEPDLTPKCPPDSETARGPQSLVEGDGKANPEGGVMPPSPR